MTNAEIKELLRLAAKAAGYKIHSDALACGPGGAEPQLYIGSRGPVWNPMDDDGDSRRLEVALCIEIEHNNPLDIERYVKAYRSGVVSLFDPVSVVEEFDDESQRLEATRLAVLRAAAAIGRAMP